MFRNNGRSRISWDQYAMHLAVAASARSEDPYVQVGAACLREDHSVASVGYNGAPSGVIIDWSNRDERRKRVIHAEVNCLNYVRPGEGSVIAVTLLPCVDCLKQIAAKRIKRILYKDLYDKDNTAIQLSKEFGIELTQLTNLNHGLD